MPHKASAGQPDAPDILRNNASQNLGANIDDVRHMEEKMLRLLEDFEAGKIVSVGADCPYDKLDAVREQQEELMRLHFELDNKMQSTTGPISGRNRQQARRLLMEEGRKTSKSNLSTLVNKLEALSHSIQNLHNQSKA
ncbi:Coiled-coil domain-containing protein 28B [Taenia solium]|eukprot:TsM_000802200 transcript=TsM_000802200 gene=TsM_000802200